MLELACWGGSLLPKLLYGGNSCSGVTDPFKPNCTIATGDVGGSGTGNVAGLCSQNLWCTSRVAVYPGSGVSGFDAFGTIWPPSASSFCFTRAVPYYTLTGWSFRLSTLPQGSCRCARYFT